VVCRLGVNNLGALPDHEWAAFSTVVMSSTPLEL
jgi:hypothetical protein